VDQQQIPRIFGEVLHGSFLSMQTFDGDYGITPLVSPAGKRRFRSSTDAICAGHKDFLFAVSIETAAS
jgi:hypothetical protein